MSTKTYFTQVPNTTLPQLVSAIGLNGSGIGDVKAGDKIITAFKTDLPTDTSTLTPWKDNTNQFSSFVPYNGWFLYTGGTPGGTLSNEPGTYMITVERN